MSESIIDDGGPVYPGQWVDFQPTTGEQVVREQWAGVSFRAEVAKECLVALVGRNSGDRYEAMKGGAAGIAVGLADALIAALKGGAK